jgi:PAS domain S-box-containing protein
VMSILWTPKNLTGLSALVFALDFALLRRRVFRCSENVLLPEVSMREEARLWLGLYRALFERNVAGAILTNRDGRILDCNASSARILGFNSCSEMLKRTAWDFYFERKERETSLRKLRGRKDCLAEEICLRRADGTPVQVLAMRTALENPLDSSEWFQGTIVDISAGKQFEELMRDGAFSERPSRMVDEAYRWHGEFLSKMKELLKSLNETLQPGNLLAMDRRQVQEILRTLETIKMMVVDLEILQLR